MAGRGRLIAALAVVAAAALARLGLGGSDDAAPAAVTVPVSAPPVAAVTVEAVRSAEATAAPGAPDRPQAPGPRPDGLAVPLGVTAPERIDVGDVSEVVVQVEAREPIRRIAFTVRFDANVLQVRAAEERPWSGAAPARFDYRIGPGDDSATVEAEVVDADGATASGPVAAVRFQAVAPGRSEVTIEDIAIDGRRGALPATLWPAHLQVTAVSAPPP